MATDAPAWMRKAQADARNRMEPAKYQPIVRPPMQPIGGSSSTARTLRSQATASSHNVFRPDIYRVSEGYLN